MRTIPRASFPPCSWRGGRDSSPRNEKPSYGARQDPLRTGCSRSRRAVSRPQRQPARLAARTLTRAAAEANAQVTRRKKKHLRSGRERQAFQRQRHLAAFPGGLLPHTLGWIWKPLLREKKIAARSAALHAGRQSEKKGTSVPGKCVSRLR